MNYLTACSSVPISTDRSQVNQYLDALLRPHRESAGQSVLKAMRYAVLGSAQRVRPVLALRIARLVGAPTEITLAAASAVELLHCASLVVDDLPCMDNSPLRRNRASLHVEFGESTALLAAFALVALAARSVLETPCEARYRDRVVNFQLALLRTLDCCALIAGQALDLESAACGLPSGMQISNLKTVPLFSLAVEAGSLVDVDDRDTRAVLSGFGRGFGLAFQMSDDLLDGEETDPNLFLEKLRLLRALVAGFGAAGQDLEALIDYLNDRVFSLKSQARSFG